LATPTVHRYNTVTHFTAQPPLYILLRVYNSQILRAISLEYILGMHHSIIGPT